VAWNEPDPALDGRVEARVDELELVTELVPDLSGLQGRLEAELVLSGTVAAPELQARAAWLEGAATLPALGIRPKGIRVEATVEDNHLRFEAGARSGDGELTATGDFDLAAEGVVGQARLSGDSVLVVDLPEARLFASPDVEFDYRPGTLRITGDVRIPSGSITGIVKGGGESVSPDQVIVSADGTPAETPGLEVHARVTVTLGPDVSLEVVGLTGKIAGELVAISRPGRLPSGRGEVRVEDGKFEAFGQELDIEAGRLVYTGGPLENPGLDIRATRTVQEVVAGVQVRGTLQYPEFTVFSDPPMPRTEALSYLTLGKGLDDLNSGEQASVNQAANALALSGGGLLARSVGEKIGLDEVGVEGDADGGSSVVVGKYLGSGLFVSYGLGLFEAVNTLKIRYQINQRLSLEATSGEEIFKLTI
jgi:translocation and assembly module TamB